MKKTMRRYWAKVCATAVLLLPCLGATAQDIEIKSFEHNVTSLIGSMREVKDNTGAACAVLKFAVRDTLFVIEPNVGFVKREVSPTADEIILWVPVMAKRLTIRREGALPLRGYKIPVTLKPKQTYDVVLVAGPTPSLKPTPSPSQKGGEQKERKNSEEKSKKERSQQPKEVKPVVPKPVDVAKPKVRDEKPKVRGEQRTAFFTFGVGYQPIAMSGPTVSVGAEVDHHLIELSGTYGLGKTDELFFYDSGYNFIVSRQYTPSRIQLRYGYEIKIANAIGIAPMIGGGVNIFSSKSGQEVDPSYLNYYLKASSFSLTPSVRLSARLGHHVKFYAAPEYSLGLYKSDNCKLISSYDKKFKSWTDGLNISAGIIILL